MYGSANATDLAAYAQWNDIYTMRGQGDGLPGVHAVFKQMARDSNVDAALPGVPARQHHVGLLPLQGRGTKKDPVMEVLNDIVCKGATDGTGTKGKTRIRIAQTSMWGDRGIMIAQRLGTCGNRGCDIKIVYAVLGNEVLVGASRTPAAAECRSGRSPRTSTATASTTATCT